MCVFPEGLARRRRRLSLRGRLCIALWITGRGVSHLGLPGDQSVRVVLMCHYVETDWIQRSVQNTLDGAARRMKRGHRPVTANKFAAGEGGRSVVDWTLSY